jgi:hypothetical protein
MWQNAKIIGENQNRGEYGQARGAKDFVMSRSQLVEFSVNPEKWLAGASVEDDSSKQMDFGSALDCLLTMPDSFEETFAVCPLVYPCEPTKKDPRTEKPWNKNSNYCDEWETAQIDAGRTVISAKMLSEVKTAFAAIQSKHAIRTLFECSAKQVLMTADWKDDETGLIVPFSALADLVPHVSSLTWGKTLADLKTARSGNPATWPRVVDDSGYDVQAALYLDIYTSATGEDRTDFVHIIQENTFPFHVVTPPPLLSSEFIDWGRSKYLAALALYCRCLAAGVWPSYEQQGIQYGNTQIIAPDGLWNYRQCAGMKEIEYVEPRAEKQSAENFDNLP